uniref:AMP_N domain-containing protein n=1 Tax=Steinernema glaseri TaxID=37863 RepID=A0A1I7ZTH4_9BILA
MDGVPFAFCEAVCVTLCRRRIPPLGELSGYYGDIARSAYPSLSDYVGIVKNGVEEQGTVTSTLLYKNERRVWSFCSSTLFCNSAFY